MTANKSFEERLTALITDVYNSHEEPHSSSSVINETVDFIKNIIQQERREAKKEEQAIREDERRKVKGHFIDREESASYEASMGNAGACDECNYCLQVLKDLDHLTTE